MEVGGAYTRKIIIDVMRGRVFLKSISRDEFTEIMKSTEFRCGPVSYAMA